MRSHDQSGTSLEIIQNFCLFYTTEINEMKWFNPQQHVCVNSTFWGGISAYDSCMFIGLNSQACFIEEQNLAKLFLAWENEHPHPVWLPPLMKTIFYAYWEECDVALKTVYLPHPRHLDIHLCVWMRGIDSPLAFPDNDSFGHKGSSLCCLW